MPNYSHLTIAGHLGRNADVKAVGERFVIKFSVAVTDKVKDAELTTWYNVSYWSKTDKIASYLTKGTPVLASGHPCLREYDKKDGTKGQSLDLEAKEVKLLGGKQDGEAAPAPKKAAPVDAGGSAGDSEPPFMRRGEWE
jgi:single-strand DNA-binding protein